MTPLREPLAWGIQQMKFDHLSALHCSLLCPTRDLVLDCCKSLMGRPLSALSPLHFVLNTAARMILLEQKSGRVLPLIKILQWCPISVRIKPTDLAMSGLYHLCLAPPCPHVQTTGPLQVLFSPSGMNLSQIFTWTPLPPHSDLC